MANHCENYLTVTGKTNDVEEFLSYCFESCLGYKTKTGVIPIDTLFSFEKILPTPKIIKNGEETIIDDWRAWRQQNWGTNWNVLEEGSAKVKVVDEDNVQLQSYFATGWTPCLPIIETLGEKFKNTSLNIRLEYYEGGCAFAGHVEYKAGEEIDSNYVEYDYKDKDKTIDYWEYIMENEYEAHDWFEESICDMIEDEEKAEELGNQINNLLRRNRFEDAAQLYVESCYAF